MSLTATDPPTCQDGHAADLSTGPDSPADATDEVLAELLVEEISIDGMCGVY